MHLNEVKVINMTCEALSKFSKAQPHECMQFFPLILERLNVVNNPEVQIKLLYTIPELATSFQNVPPIAVT
eukprot:UN12584